MATSETGKKNVCKIGWNFFRFFFSTFSSGSVFCFSCARSDGGTTWYYSHFCFFIFYCIFINIHIFCAFLFARCIDDEVSLSQTRSPKWYRTQTRDTQREWIKFRRKCFQFFTLIFSSGDLCEIVRKLFYNQLKFILRNASGTGAYRVKHGRWFHFLPLSRACDGNWKTRTSFRPKMPFLFEPVNNRAPLLWHWHWHWHSAYSCKCEMANKRHFWRNNISTRHLAPHSNHWISWINCKTLRPDYNVSFIAIHEKSF